MGMIKLRFIGKIRQLLSKKIVQDKLISSVELNVRRRKAVGVIITIVTLSVLIAGSYYKAYPPKTDPKILRELLEKLVKLRGGN
jgi:hypothetical protein